MFPACPLPSGAANKLNTDMQGTAINWVVGDPTHEANWILHPHASIAGRNPFEHWARGTAAIFDPAGHAAGATASAASTRTVSLHDDYYSPSALTVKAGTTIRWNWGSGLTDTHDVMLASAPRGVKRFMSDYAAGGYSFKHMLKVPGKYKFVCDLHQGMTLKVTVKR